MYITADTIDDLMFKVLSELLKIPFTVSSTRTETNGKSSEVIGCMLHLSNPRARLSRTETKGTPFSALGELLWYLAGSNSLDFIKYYIAEYQKESDDGHTLYGAYGPRLLNSDNKHNQLENVIKLLKEKPTSRRAAIQLFESKDLVEIHKEIPCTCTLQFLLRDERLHMITFMRSNDAFLGLPHDIFAFTMLQEIIARSIDVEIGTYCHSVGSLHLYECKKEKAQQYLNEGAQSTKKYMPKMPEGNPWQSIKILLKFESQIRNGEAIEVPALNLNNYWSDIAYLLQIFRLFKDSEYDLIKQLKNKFSNSIYNTYIQKKLVTSQRK